MSGTNPSPLLLLDEDVRPLLADVLRQRGYDAVHVLEIDRGGRSDDDQPAYASLHGRTLLTHNIRDFLVLDQACRSQEREHCGILLSDQVPFRELLRRTLRCLNHHTGSELRGRVEWLHRFKQIASVLAERASVPRLFPIAVCTPPVRAAPLDGRSPLE